MFPFLGGALARRLVETIVIGVAYAIVDLLTHKRPGAPLPKDPNVKSKEDSTHV